MFLKATILVLPLAFRAGCVGAGDAPVFDDDPALSGKADGITWQKMVTCNGGAAVVDANTGGRRDVQFVIRDAEAVNYLTGAIGQQLLLNRGNGRELIVHGWSEGGLFGASDFDALEEQEVSPTAHQRAFREGGGIRVVFERQVGIQGRLLHRHAGRAVSRRLPGWHRRRNADIRRVGQLVLRRLQLTADKRPPSRLS